MIKDFISSISKDGLMILCGIVVLASFLFITYAAVFIKAANADMANILFGNITTMVGGVVGYYFGTSKSSVDKTKIMADKANQ